MTDAAELLDLAAGALHHLGRQRVGVGDDGDRRQHGDGGVAPAEDEVEPGVDPHALGRVVAARGLREPEPPAVGGTRLVLEEVGLHVDDELARRRARWSPPPRRSSTPAAARTCHRCRAPCRSIGGRSVACRVDRWCQDLVGDGARDVVVAASSLLHAASAVNVAAIPQLDRRNARRDIPSRRALVSATASVRRIASATTSERGNGAYSPFDSGWNASGRPGSSGGRRVMKLIVGPPGSTPSAAVDDRRASV